MSFSKKIISCWEYHVMNFCKKFVKNYNTRYTAIVNGVGVGLYPNWLQDI